MVHWVWLILAFVAGANIGVLLMAFVAGCRRNEMRLIDADVLRDSLRESYDKLREIYDGLMFDIEKRLCACEMATLQEVLFRIKDAPTVDAEPVQHGEWIPFSDHMWACSNCRVMGSPQWKRCPVCEAKMDGGLPHNVGQTTGGAEDENTR